MVPGGTRLRRRCPRGGVAALPLPAQCVSVLGSVVEAIASYSVNVSKAPVVVVVCCSSGGDDAVRITDKAVMRG